MPTIAPTSTTTAPTAATGASFGGNLGKNDFLKLLVGQLQHQDPLNPSSDTEFIGQMTQFSMLEQLGNLADTTRGLADRTGAMQTVGLLGRTVTCTGADGAPITGTVDAVDLTDGAPTITVAGIAGIDPTTVSQVR
ncbi:MAG: hypothetical protein LT070_08055 [Solirubrobacteraceae bacterium]|nr:hypothetical protein [Solirubrobacteraceae bacterium]